MKGHPQSSEQIDHQGRKVKVHLLRDVRESLRVTFDEARLEKGEPQVGAEKEKRSHRGHALQEKLQVSVKGVPEIVRPNGQKAPEPP